MISFADLSKQVHSINDLILSDMVCDPDNTAEEAVLFSKHLLATKFWFARISYMNKKRYLLVLLQDTRSAWTLSLLLKSMWNCRPKDAVMSVSEQGGRYTSYDEAPMDHNRTALPVHTLATVMKNDRLWYHSLAPETQALVLSELLTIAGGPAMWEVLRRAETLYNRYQERILQSLQECVVVSDTLNGKSKDLKKDHSSASGMVAETVAETTATPASKGQRNLEANLATWNATIKALQDSLKLEELEMTFNDGTKKKIWKVNRPKPDVMETVDFVQLLPSAVAKRILSYLPRAQLLDYARVNKYWAYLVDEYRSELAARIKIDADYAKLEEILIRNDEALYEFIRNDELDAQKMSSVGMTSVSQQPPHLKYTQSSVKASEKSGGAYSLRHFSDKLNKPVIAQTPIRNMAELNERMERRGATDENIWKWCENIVAHAMKQKKRAKKGLKASKLIKKTDKKPNFKLSKEEEVGGILTLGNVHFPCPLMKHSIVVPLAPPLCKDPALTKVTIKPRKSLTDTTIKMPMKGAKRYSLWTRDVSPLYPVFKIPSYQFQTNLF